MKRLTILILLGVAPMVWSQVGVNTTNPTGGSILDISATDKGILIPRVNLTQLNTIAPITGGAPESLLVYNTNTTTGPGFFYWNGTNWTPMTSQPGWQLTGNSGIDPTYFIGTTDDQPLHLATDGTTRMTINTDPNPNHNGNIIINPNAYSSLVYDRLLVAEDILGKPAFQATITNDDSEEIVLNAYHANFSGGAAINSSGFYGIIAYGTQYAGLFNGDVNVNGNVEAYAFNTPSDARIKTNIRPITNALDKVLQLRPALYDKDLNLVETDPKNVSLNKNQTSWKTASSNLITEYGLLAQELELVFPELVQNSKTTLNDQPDKPLKTVNYTGLIPILIQAMQDQQQQIDQQNQQIAELQQRLDRIEKK